MSKENRPLEKSARSGYFYIKKNEPGSSFFPTKDRTLRPGQSPYGMIIITSFNIRDNSEDGGETYSTIVLTGDVPPCPICFEELRYRDSRGRKVKDYLGEVRRFKLRRLRCEKCRHLHTEIPDIIQPFKHYDSEAIQAVIDGDKRAESCAADTSTMRRWKADMRDALPDISQRVAAVDARETNEAVPLASAETVIENIKKRCRRWLAFVMVLLINSGSKLCTRFAFCPSPSPVRVSVETERNGRKGRKNVKEVKDSG